MYRQSDTLLLIVVSQFFCTSLWFSGNVIVIDIATANPDHFAAHFTSAVQFGFISGTLLFALLAITDRYSPSKVFLVSAVLASLCNLGLTLPTPNLQLLGFRFLTGFFLAGIYPVGMKIASDYYKEGLGKSLGFLVGALVLGTALPHLLKASLSSVPWQVIVVTTSGLAVLGGLIVFWRVPDGPFRKVGHHFSFSHVIQGYTSKALRSAAIGYFGHMWELYTFWAFVPFILSEYSQITQQNVNVPGWSFVIIGIGAVACGASGQLSSKYGEKRVATVALAISCACCMLAPFVLKSPQLFIVLAFLLIWGVAVIADSPLFSAMVASEATAEWRGSALTIVTCIGFAITIVSLQIIRWIADWLPFPHYLIFLAIGPGWGLVSLLAGRNKK